MKATNGGCSQYPCWRCRPCHNAVKGIETAARKRNQSKSLNKFRTDPVTRPRWKRIVALIRIPEGSDCPNSYELQVFDEEGYPGAPTPATKMLRVEPFLKMLKHEESMEEIDDRLFLTERQYKCHLKLFEDYKPAEAQDKWDHDSLETSGVARKKNKHNELTLAMEIPMCLRHVNRVVANFNQQRRHQHDRRGTFYTSTRIYAGWLGHPVSRSRRRDRGIPARQCSVWGSRGAEEATAWTDFSRHGGSIAFRQNWRWSGLIGEFGGLVS